MLVKNCIFKFIIYLLVNKKSNNNIDEGSGTDEDAKYDNLA